MRQSEHLLEMFFFHLFLNLLDETYLTKVHVLDIRFGKYMYINILTDF